MKQNKEATPSPPLPKRGVNKWEEGEDGQIIRANQHPQDPGPESEKP